MMPLQQVERFYDLTLVCFTIAGLTLLAGYIAFAHFVTHRGDFYHRRRWKTAIWFAVVPTVIVSGILLYLSIVDDIGTWTSRNMLDRAGSIIESVMSTLALVIPLLFVLTWGAHHQLKWWFNSDDYLDKIWKDPSKGHKSPVQEI